jgi:hypothetical protein
MWSQSKRLKKPDKRSAIILRKIKSERMAFHSISLHAARFEAGGNIVVPYPAWVIPVFQRGALPPWPNMLRYQTPLSDGTL